MLLHMMHTCQYVVLMQMAQKWYVVNRGRVPGIYTSWKECRKQVNGYANNDHKGFNTRKEAEDYYNPEVPNVARQIINAGQIINPDPINAGQIINADPINAGQIINADPNIKNFIILILVIILAYLCCFR